MNVTQKTLAACAALILVPASGASAQETAPRGPWEYSVSASPFFGWGQEKLFSNDLDKLDIAGVGVKASAVIKESILPGTKLFPEIFGLVNIGCGSLDQTWYYYGGSYERNYDLTTVQAAVGANLRLEIDDRVSVFGGIRAGLAYENLEVEAQEEGHRWTWEESDVGLLYGIGFGADVRINDHSGVTVALDYVGSTAQPEFDIYGEKAEAKKQSYIMLSVGYKYTF